MPRRKKDQIDDHLQETTPEQAPEPQPIPTEQPDEAATADETNFVNIEQKITAEAFDDSRAELIKQYSGSQDIGENTMNAMIADLLGFAQSGQRWRPCTRYTMRRDDGSENIITLYRCPVGLYSASVVLTGDRVNDDYEREKISIDSDIDFSRPATDSIRLVDVFDTEAEALKDIFYAACEEIHGHISFGAETQDWLSDVFLGVVKPEPIEEGEDEPLPAAERQEETEGQDFPDTSLLNTEDRQRELAPDVFPTFKTMLTVGQERTQELIEMVNSKLMSEERALKEIKKKAQSPVKEQIDRKKQTIEMFKRLSCYLDVAKAIEDARLKSKMEDLTYHVYAIPADNGAWVKTGSGQDRLDDVFAFGEAYVFDIAEFSVGELAGAETGDYPTTQDAEIAHSEPQEGAKLAEEGKLPTVVIHDGWKCPHGEFEEILSAENADEARGLFECTTHEYCEGCEGPEFVGDIEVEGLDPAEAAGDEPCGEDSDLPAAEPGTDESEEGAA